MPQCNAKMTAASYLPGVRASLIQTRQSFQSLYLSEIPQEQIASKYSMPIAVLINQWLSFTIDVCASQKNLKLMYTSRFA